MYFDNTNLRYPIEIVKGIEYKIKRIMPETIL